MKAERYAQQGYVRELHWTKLLENQFFGSALLKVRWCPLKIFFVARQVRGFFCPRFATAQRATGNRNIVHGPQCTEMGNEALYSATNNKYHNFSPVWESIERRGCTLRKR